LHQKYKCCVDCNIYIVFPVQENPNPQPYVQKIPRPTDGAYMRVHQPVFPLIDIVKVNEIIEEGTAKQNAQSK
jgi:myotubularin-related protein 5/13